MVSQDLLDSIERMAKAIGKLKVQMSGLQNLVPCSICAAIIPASAEQKHITWHYMNRTY